MEDKKPSNPSAFPQGYEGYLEPTSGMTLRDYFAAQAMTAILANQQLFLKVLESQEDKTIRSSDGIANNAYAIADSMLKHREL